MARYSIIIPAGAPLWAQQLQAPLNALFARIEADMRPPYLLKAQLPTDGSIRRATVLDAVGGETPAFLDSVGVWRRSGDLTVVS